MEIVLAAVDRVSTMFRGIDGSINKSKQNIKDYRRRIRELQAGIPTTGPLTRQQQRDQREIERTTRLIDRQNKRLKYLYRTQAVQNRGRSMMMSGGVQMAAAGAAGYGAMNFMQDGMDFDTTMSKVQALTRLDKNDPMLAALRANAKELGATTWADPTQVAQGQSFYAMAGFKPDQIIDSMSGTLDLAKAGDVDIATAADIGSNILSAFGLTADQMGRVGDILVGTFTRTNTDLNMLGETMKYVGPIAKGLGISLEETSAMAGVLGNVGIQGSEAGTAMRAIFKRLAAGPSMARKELEKLNVNTKDKDGNLRKPMELLAEVLKKTSTMGNAERMGILSSIAGTEAAAAFSAMIDKGNLDDITRIIDELSKNHGESARIAKTMSDNLTGDVQQLNSAWTDFKITVFETNDGGLRPTFQTLTKIMNAIGAFAKANPETIKQFSNLAAAVIGFTAALGLAKLAYGAFTFAVLGNPIGATIALIGFALYAVIKNWDTLVWFFNDGVHNIGKDLRKLTGWIGGLIGQIPLVGSELQLVWDISSNIWLKLGGLIKRNAEKMGEAVAMIVGLFTNFDGTMAVIKEDMKAFWDDMVNWARPAIDEIIKIIQPFVDTYNHLTGKRVKFTQKQQLVHDYNTNPKAFVSHQTNKYNDLVKKAPGLDQIVSLDEYLKAVKHGDTDDVKAKMLDYQMNQQAKQTTQNNTFTINITAPNGNTASIADAVKRGIESVTNKNNALLGDAS